MAKKRDLTPFQKKFVVEYAIDQNGTQAAIRAGYAESGASVEAVRQLRNARIRDAIQRELNDHLNDRKIKTRTIVNRLDDLATVDPAEAYDETGHIKPWAEIPIEVRRCIKEVTIREEWDGQGPNKTKVAEIIKLTFYDRVKANELLGKNLKMFADKLEVDHKVSLEALVEKSNEPPRDVTPGVALIEGEVDETDSE